MAASGKGVGREERVKQVLEENKSAHDFKNYVPIGDAVQTLETWVQRGYEIFYLTSRRSLEEIENIQNVLLNYRFPSGVLLYRKKDEGYKDVAERLIPDILIEDDCESIGGEAEMTYPNIRLDIRARIKHYPVKEFGGIDHLIDVLN